MRKSANECINDQCDGEADHSQAHDGTDRRMRYPRSEKPHQCAKGRVGKKPPQAEGDQGGIATGQSGVSLLSMTSWVSAMLPRSSISPAIKERTNEKAKMMKKIER